MRKVVFLSSAVLVVAALVFAGGDPWKSKPYQQWDAKDVQRVLEDSPWSKIIQVEATWKNGKDNSGNDMNGPAVATNQQVPAGGGGGKSVGGSAPSAPAAATPGAGDSGNSSGSASFLIRWVSSKTVEKAVYRKAQLAGQMKPEDAEKELAKQLDVYELVVFGPDMKPFQSADEGTLKTDGYLIEKKTKQKISPMKVEITRAPDGTSTSRSVPFPKEGGQRRANHSGRRKKRRFYLFRERRKNSHDLRHFKDARYAGTRSLS